MRQLVLGNFALTPLKGWQVSMESSQCSYMLARSVPDLHYCSASGFLGRKPGHVVIIHLQAVNGPDLTKRLLAPMLQKAGRP